MPRVTRAHAPEAHMRTPPERDQPRGAVAASYAAVLAQPKPRRKPKPTPEEADAEDAEGIAPKEDENGMQTRISSFRDKNIGKPEPWDGEDEATFKM